MNQAEFYAIWIESAFREREEAKRMRRLARQINSDSARVMATRYFNRAIFDLSQARRFRSAEHAN